MSNGAVKTAPLVASLALLVLPGCAVIDAIGGGGGGLPDGCVTGLPCLLRDADFVGPVRVRTLAVVDVDGDSYQDVVFAGLHDEGGEQLWTLSGDAEGSFHSTYISVPLGAVPVDVLVLDMYADGGLPDLVVLGEDGSLLRLNAQLGSPSGFSVVPGTNQASTESRWLLPIDANLDGLPEIAVVSTWDIEVLDPRAGTLGPPAGLALPECVGATVGTFFQGERPMLALLGGDQRVRLLAYETSTSSWQGVDDIGAQDLSRDGRPAAGDLDGDLVDDLVLPIACGGGCEVYARVYTPRHGTWKDLVSPDPFVPSQLIAAQLDDDPLTDVLAVNPGGHLLDPPDLVIAANRGDHFELAVAAAGEGPQLAAVGRLDGDDLNDVAVTRLDHEIDFLLGVRP